MITSRAGRPLLALGLVIGLVIGLAACGGDDDDSKDAASTTSTTSTEGAADGGVDEGADADGGTTTVTHVTDDTCDLIPAEKVAEIIEEEGVVADKVAGGGCVYLSDATDGLLPTVIVADEADTPGGIEGARRGAEGALGVTGSAITVGGHPGYLVAGEMEGASSAQAAAAVNGKIVTVTLSANDPEAATQILELAVAALS